MLSLSKMSFSDIQRIYYPFDFRQKVESEYGQYFVHSDEVMRDIQLYGEQAFTDKLAKSIASEVNTLTRKYPLYPIDIIDDKVCARVREVLENNITRLIDELSKCKNDEAVSEFAKKIIACELENQKAETTFRNLAMRFTKIEKEDNGRSCQKNNTNSTSLKLMSDIDIQKMKPHEIEKIVRLDYKEYLPPLDMINKIHSHELNNELAVSFAKQINKLERYKDLSRRQGQPIKGFWNPKAHILVHKVFIQCFESDIQSCIRSIYDCENDEFVTKILEYGLLDEAFEEKLKGGLANLSGSTDEKQDWRRESVTGCGGYTVQESQQLSSDADLQLDKKPLEIRSRKRRY